MEKGAKKIWQNTIFLKIDSVEEKKTNLYNRILNPSTEYNFRSHETNH